MYSIQIVIQISGQRQMKFPCMAFFCLFCQLAVQSQMQMPFLASFYLWMHINYICICLSLLIACVWMFGTECEALLLLLLLLIRIEYTIDLYSKCQNQQIKNRNSNKMLIEIPMSCFELKSCILQFSYIFECWRA